MNVSYLYTEKRVKLTFLLFGRYLSLSDQSQVSFYIQENRKAIVSKVKKNGRGK